MPMRLMLLRMRLQVRLLMMLLLVAAALRRDPAVHRVAS